VLTIAVWTRPFVVHDFLSTTALLTIALCGSASAGDAFFLHMVSWCAGRSYGLRLAA
jgi:hypothetical protein